MCDLPFLTAVDDAMQRFVAGALNFRQREYHGDDPRMRGLTEAQHPRALLVGCADSRIDPALICGSGPGELFTIRNVANLVPPYAPADQAGHSVRAALEYGVKVLRVPNIIVLGHARCGGIRAVIDTVAGEAPPSEFLAPWLAQARGACDQQVQDPATGEMRCVAITNLREHAHVVERASVLNSVANLRTYPWIVEREAAGQLALHGWWFDLETGDLWTTHPQTGAFLPVDGH